MSDPLYDEALQALASARTYDGGQQDENLSGVVAYLQEQHGFLADLLAQLARAREMAEIWHKAEMRLEQDRASKMEALRDAREALRVLLHAHASGNSVSPHMIAGIGDALARIEKELS